VRYSQVLKPELKSKEVEDYLRKQNRTVSAQCCATERTRRTGRWMISR